MKKIFFLFLVITIFTFNLYIDAQTWGPLKRLTWNSGDSFAPVIAVDSSNNIHMVWTDQTPGNGEIFYKKSTDSGSTWTGNKRLTWNSGGSKNPSLVVDSADRIHLVWEDSTPGNYEIYYKKSTNSGTSWSGIKRLTWISGASRSPILAVDSADRIHLVWTDSASSNYEIYYKKSTNSGTAWTGSKRLTWSAGYSDTPYISSTGSNDLLVSWKDSKPGNNEIYIKRSTDSGNNWTGMKRLTWNAGSSAHPITDVDSSNNIFLIWQDATPGNKEIYFKKSTDGGINWGSFKRLTWTSGSSNFPWIGIDNNNHINTTWKDNTAGNYEVYFRKSTNGGTSWQAKKQITWNSGDAYDPFITSNNNNLHLTWGDDTPGNVEIFYKKASLAQAPVLSAPASSTGTFTLTVIYNWPFLTTQWNRFLLYEKPSTSSTWTLIQESTYGQHPNPWNVQLSKSAGTYSYKVRAYVGSGYTPYSNIKTVVVTLPPEITAYASADNTLMVAGNFPQWGNTVYQWGDISVGNQFSIGLYFSDYMYVASVLKFDGLQAQIAGRSIASATLKLYPTMLPGDWNTEYAVNALHGSWNTATITLNNCPNYYLSYESKQPPPVTTVVPLEFNITQIVQAWANGNWVNNGLLARDIITTFPALSVIRTTSFNSADAYDHPNKRPQVYIIFN